MYGYHTVQLRWKVMFEHVLNAFETHSQCGWLQRVQLSLLE